MHPVLRKFENRLRNLHCSGEIRSRILDRFATAQLCTANLDITEFVELVVRNCLSKRLPKVLVALGKVFPAESALLNGLAEGCSAALTFSEMRNAAHAAYHHVFSICHRAYGPSDVALDGDAFASAAASAEVVSRFDADAFKIAAEFPTCWNAVSDLEDVYDAATAGALAAYFADVAIAGRIDRPASANENFYQDFAAKKLSYLDNAVSDIAEFAIAVLSDMGAPGTRYIAD